MREFIDMSVPQSHLQSISTILKVLPRKIRNGAMRVAGKKSAQIIQRNIKPLVPVSKRDVNMHGPFQNPAKNAGGYVHLRDGIISKIKTYPNAIFVAVGPQTKANLNHAHLIEFGTRLRYTRHTTNSDRYEIVGRKMVRKKNKAGKKYWAEVPIKRSIGSELDEKKLKHGPSLRRGAVKPRRFMQRGWAQAEAGVNATIEHELRKAIASLGVSV